MKASFAQHGYAVARGLFSEAEVEEIKSTFARIAENGPVRGHFEPVSKEESGGDPLKEFPRVMHPHRFDALSRKNLVHPGVMTCLQELMQDEVLAAQSMFYYKPPGSRGQAMHQDNFYLLVEPQTCVAAWTAIDDADPENGGMYLVADTAEEEIACPEKANAAESFTTHFVPTPKGKKAVPCVMKAGDTLFFNGSSIHGSGPNRSKDRFRRSFICHYVPKSTQRISKFYLPLLTPEGQDVMIEANSGGGACGNSWQDGAYWEGGTH
jgi:ectoine hydroxylase-related dioxygenase (phytanoyl-CoA dioxygenase family)